MSDTTPYICGERQAKLAAFERVQIVGLIMQTPGITAREISQKMKRSYAATSCQLRRLLETDEVSFRVEVYFTEQNIPRRAKHYYVAVPGDPHVESTGFDMPKQLTVTKWKKDAPEPWDLMAIFYKIVTA